MRALPRSQVRSDPDQGLLRDGGHFREHHLLRVSAGAQSCGRRIQDAGKADREQRKAAARIPGKGKRATGGVAGAAVVPVYAGGVESTGRAERRSLLGGSGTEAGLRTVRALAEIPGQAAEVLPVSDKVAGDDQARRHGRGSQNAWG